MTSWLFSFRSISLKNSLFSQIPSFFNAEELANKQKWCDCDRNDNHCFTFEPKKKSILKEEDLTEQFHKGSA